MNVNERNNVRFRKVNYPGFDDRLYFISEYGDLYNAMTNTIISGTITKKGYRQFRIKGIAVKAHRLVAYAFIEKNRDIKLTVDHLDGNKLNNYYKNLEWVSAEENVRRAFESGTIEHLSYYGDELVHKICSMYEQYNYSPIELYRVMRKTNNSPRGNKAEEAFYRFLVSLRKKEIRLDIVKLYNYNPNEVFGDKKVVNDKSLFSKDQIESIAVLYLSGKNVSQITKVLGIETSNPDYNKYYSTILRIVHRKAWTKYTDEIFRNAHENIETEKYNSSRFSEDQVHEICKYLADRKTPHEILGLMGYLITDPDYARLYEIIGRIANGRVWLNVSKDYFEPFHLSNRQDYKLNQYLIGEMVAQNYSIKDICRVYGIKTKIENPNLYSAIRKQIKRIKTLKCVSELTFEELQNLMINEWAGRW
nr:MAG TPA: homing endonuclease [Caudoviricetes sp.]